MLLREGIASVLERKGFEIVGQSGTADDLMLKVRSYNPDIAIVDIKMPPTQTDEGLRAAKEIRGNERPPFNASSRSRRLARPVPGAAARPMPTPLSATRCAARRDGIAPRADLDASALLARVDAVATAFSTRVSSAIDGKRSARAAGSTSTAKLQPVGHAHVHQLEVGAHAAAIPAPSVVALPCSRGTAARR